MKLGREDDEMEDTNTKSSYSTSKFEQKHGTFYIVILPISIYPHLSIYILFISNPYRKILFLHSQT